MHPPGLLHDLLALLHTEQPAHLGPEHRPCALPIRTIDQRIEEAFKDVALEPKNYDLFRALIFIWHDHLDEGHSLAQEIDTREGSLVHGIMHRREPDYGNAKYWFRRVGVHPSFHSLAVRARELLEKHHESDLHSRLLPNNTWDPFAFIDAVEDSVEGQFRSKIPLLQQIQRLEFEALLENLVNRI